MNLKTTFVLLAVVAGAAAVWWLTPALPSWVGPTDYRLAFAEKAPPGDDTAKEPTDRLAIPTWLRLDTRPEVVRLAPGLVGALRRPADYYLQRRLFPFERVAKGDEGPDKQEKI